MGFDALTELRLFPRLSWIYSVLFDCSSDGYLDMRTDTDLETAWRFKPELELYITVDPLLEQSERERRLNEESKRRLLRLRMVK